MFHVEHFPFSSPFRADGLELTGESVARMFHVEHSEAGSSTLRRRNWGEMFHVEHFLGACHSVSSPLGLYFGPEVSRRGRKDGVSKCVRGTLGFAHNRGSRYGPGNLSAAVA